MTKTKLPKIIEIYINGEKADRREWKYNRRTGKLNFRHPVPAGAEIKVVYYKDKKEKK